MHELTVKRKMISSSVMGDARQTFDGLSIRYKKEVQMKVAVSASSKNLDAPIDQRFGRCAFFMVVDTDDMSFEAVDNENAALSGGAGIQAAQLLASKGVEVIITGNIGPNAVKTLSAAGVQVVTGQTGTVRQAVDDFKKGKVKESRDATVSDHYGMDQGGPGMGQGMGGRGMGRRMGGRGMGGRGMGGRGMGRGTKR